MSRPRYHREEDRQRERECAKLLARALGMDARLMELHSDYDIVLQRDGITEAVVELKCRNTERDEHETVFMEPGKHAALMRAGVPALFAVWWRDELAVIDASSVDTSVRGWGGRKDRNDPHDERSDMILVPTARFTTIRKGGWA